MSKPKFPWRRFWCAPDALLHLEPDGYLTDCEDSYGKLLAPETKTFQEMEKIHCLILMGEPGIGKSTAIQDEIARRQQLEGSEDLTTVVNLKEYGSEELFCKAVFENATWQNYLRGSCELHLFLDSLDEIRIRINNVQHLLLRGFRDCPLDKLFLRIACRTAEWPSSFYDQLCELWSREEVRPFELAPLTRRNVVQAAELVGIKDVPSLMRTLHEKDIGPLASKPITLDFLLGLYATEGDLPTGRTDLYSRGCLYLCEEPDRERREKSDIDRHYTGLLSPTERLALASRIAAVLAFSNGYAVYRNGLSAIPEGCVSVAQLAGGIETVDGRILDVTEDAIRDTLKTGLFSSRGSNLFGFAHQTYQEYLAARYLARSDIRQIRELLSHPHDANVIIPQLQETAAWVAGERRDVMRWLMSVRPETLLRSDLSMVDALFKKELTEELLKRFMADALFDDPSLRDDYHKLAYPGMAYQLKPIIENKLASLVLRCAAIDIAEACGVLDLQAVLADIALDTSETVELRAQAGNAVCEIADECTRRRLEALAQGELNEDPKDELKAYGLKCVWPDLWDVCKLFENLTPVKNRNYIGAYHYFLNYQGPEQLRKSIIPADQAAGALAIAKKWMDPASCYDSQDFGRIYKALLEISLKQVPDHQVMTELSAIIRLTMVYGPFYTDYEEDHVNPWEEMAPEIQKRHDLVNHIITTGSLDERDIAVVLPWSETRLLSDSDFPWLLKQIENAEGPLQMAWAKLIIGILNPDLSVQWISEFLEVRLRVPALQNEYLVFWELDSALSKRFKESYMQGLRREKRAQQEPTVPPAIERIEPLLKSIELGDTHKWFDLTHSMWIDENTGRAKDRGRIDLGQSPGWKSLDQPLRVRVEQAAIKFIMNYSPPSDEWFGKSSGDPDIFSVCMALLIIGRRPDIVNQIKDTEWTKWIPYMIDNTFFFVDSANCELFTLAYQRAPETASKYLMRLMKAEDRRGQGIYCLEHLRECWPPHLSELMLKTLMNCELKISSFESLARHLIEVGAEGTDEVIIDKFRQQTYEGDGASDLLVELAVLLLNHWAEKYWLDLWEFLKNNKELSLRVLGRIDPAYRRRAGFAEQLTDFHLGDLYSLMCELWPSKDDPPWDGGALTEQHRYAELRNNAFMILVNRGTKEACTAIESLMQRFPDQKSWMAWRLKEAQANYFRRTWTPPSAVQIISLLSNSNRRYVENEEELLSVVLESLGRFQNDCKSSSPPAVGAYWNYQKVGNKRTDFRPKEEEDLSDGIARWLRNDLGPSRGIITNREVQVRREQKTDIYINAVARKPDGDSTLLTAVVEVKGCWNEELHKAMETQLVDRYLRENGLAYGLYVVGWYLCDKWNDADPRKVRAKQMSFEELSEQLLKQAGDLAARNDFVRKIEPLILDLGL